MGKISRGCVRLLKRDLEKRRKASLLQERKTGVKEDTLGSDWEPGVVVSGYPAKIQEQQLFG